MTNTTNRFWFFNGGNKLIIGNLEYESFEAARQAARQMNRDGAHATLGFVEIIANAPRIAEGTVTTVNAPQTDTFAGMGDDIRKNGTSYGLLEDPK